MNITEILTEKTSRELATELRHRVLETRESDDAADTAEAETEVSQDMVKEWQTFAGSPGEEALTAAQADELMTYITEVELLNFPSL